MARGRKKLYNDETVPLAIRVPKKYKKEIHEKIKLLLKEYEVKKNEI